MLRAALVLLLAANGLFFAWARGWLDPVWPPPGHGLTEPGRLTNQLRPEMIVVLGTEAPNATSTGDADPTAAAPGPGTATACLEAGPFGEEAIAAAESVLAGASLTPGQWARIPVSAVAPAQRWQLRASTATPALQDLLVALRDPALGDGFKPCTGRP